MGDDRFFKLRAFAVLLAFGLAPGSKVLAQNQQPLLPPVIEPIHVVIDIDRTILDTVEQKTPAELLASATLIPKTGKIFGNRYIVLDGAPEMIAAFSGLPDVKVSLFSRGNRARNLAVLEQLKLPDGRSAKDVAYRIFSLEDAPLPKKDLYKVIGKNGDIDRVIMIDDHLDYAVSGQHRNLLWLPHPEQPRIHRYQLVRATGLVLAVLELAKSTQKPIREILWNFQWKKDGAERLVYRKELLTDRSLYEKGMEFLRGVNPQYTIPSVFLDELRQGCLWRALTSIRAPS
ncbi:MAG TPA: hypothetical protein VJB59_01865 [Bdellovibrionota bacterium]|nr:hypothetical protein [Bdellovibrionota bacterium]